MPETIYDKDIASFESRLELTPKETFLDVQAFLKGIEEDGPPSIKCDIWNLTGRYYILLGEYAEAKNAYEKALGFAKMSQDDRRLCCSMKNMGVLLMKLSMFHHAFKVFLEARSTALMNNFVLLQGQIENNIAVIQVMNGNYAEAQQIFQHLLENTKEMGLSKAISHYNLVDVALYLCDLNSAAQHIHDGKLAAIEENKQYLLAGFSYFTGVFMFRNGRYLLAERQLIHALAKCLDYSMKEEAVRCTYELTLLYEKNGDWEQMIANAKKTITLGQNLFEMDEVLYAHEKIVEGWHKLGNGEKAWFASLNYAQYLEKKERQSITMTFTLMEMALELIQNRRLKVKLEKELAIDAMTGLESYRNLDIRVAAMSCPVGTPFCVLFMDIDHLKHVNDIHGHGIGDKLIIAFAEAMSIILPKKSILTRKSGDEFVAYLPDTTLATAIEIAEDFLDKSKTERLVGGIPLTLACSIGIATARYCGDEPIGCIQRADMAMLQAKRLGRLSIVVSGEDECFES